jgi:hypothetical protein
VTVRDELACESPCARERCGQCADETDGSPANAGSLGLPVCSEPDHRFCAIGGTVFSKLRAVSARFENLLTVAPAKI